MNTQIPSFQELENQNNEFKLLFDTIKEGIYSSNRGILTNVNKAFCDLFGYTKEELIGMPAWNLAKPELQDEVREGFIKRLKMQDNAPVITECMRKNGDCFFAEISISFQNDYTKNFGIVRDKSSKFKKEQELIIAKEIAEKNEIRYRKLIDNINAGVVVHAADTSIIKSNARANELLGLSDNQMKGKVAIDPDWKFIDENNNTIPINNYPVMRIIKSRDTINDQYLGVCRSKDDIVWLLVNGFPVINSNGEILEIVVSFIDITQRKKAKQLLQEKIEELNQSNKELFLAKEIAEESEEKFRSIVNSSPTAMYFYRLENDSMLVLIDANPSADRVIGISHESLIGMTIEEAFPKLVETEIPELYKKVARKEIGYQSFDIPYIDDRFSGIYRVFVYSTQKDTIAVEFVDISEKHKAKQALIESETFLNETNEMAKIGGWKFDLIHQKLIWTKEVYKIHEVDDDYQPMIENAIDFYDDDSKAIIQKSVEEVIKYGKPFNVELGINTAKGNHVIVQTKGGAQRNDSGEIVYLFGTFQDITDRKIKELELIEAKTKVEESEKLFKSLIDNAPDGVVIIDINGKFKYTSPNSARHFGYDENEILDHSGDEYTHPEDLLLIYKTFETILQNPDLKPKVQYRFRHKNGDYRWIETTFTNLLSDKTINGFILNFTDITERKKTLEDLVVAKEKAERNEVELTKVQEIAHLGSWYLNVETNEVVWSKELYNMYGFDPTLPPPPYTEHKKLFTNESWEILSSSLAKTAEKGIPYQLELKTVKKDGGYGWMWVRGEAVLDESNKIIGLWGAAQDISERKQNEAELIKAKDKAEESDRLKSAFLANMSHEIRTPMNGILGFAYLLKDPNLDGEEQQECIEMIEKSGKRMLNIINDIIDISKIEAGLMKLYIKESNINEQIDYIYTFFKPEAEAKNIKLLLKKSLTDRNAIIQTDKEKVYAIFTNLVKNAIKFTKNGSIEIGYNLKFNNEQWVLELYVKDTGIGIPKDRQEAIFERFIQADISNKMAHQGAGLGLSISKAYIEMLGGKIWLISEEGVGSTFYFTLPYNAN